MPIIKAKLNKTNKELSKRKELFFTDFEAWKASQQSFLEEMAKRERRRLIGRYLFLVIILVLGASIILTSSAFNLFDITLESKDLAGIGATALIVIAVMAIENILDNFLAKGFDVHSVSKKLREKEKALYSQIDNNLEETIKKTLNVRSTKPNN